MKAAVVYKPDSLDVAESVKEFLLSLNVEAEVCEQSKELENYNFIVSVGGDGTILRTLQMLDECPPIFGVNTGKVGLLTHASPEDFKEKLGKAIEDMNIEEFMRIECTNGERLIALNEIALLTAVPARLVEFTVCVDGIEIEKMRGDGLLISTPIGSTAYALSTGGPIIDPRMYCVLVVPVAPFKLGWKPWVVDASRTVEVTIHNRPCLAIADGHRIVEIPPGSKLVFEKSGFPARFFKIPNRIKRITEMLRKMD
ncbi:NAD(+)/NADH kinase [Archaeoglobus veneficus]|uniref:NAD kinase n=1 Tax=Archaeoglobus veneficus (strain DSM 11195 / SNP6) TaxID=693661 RepID=F2KMM0_ARCVS|nr:NAD(+)/NADH kinase [Archaeoglobus veneficus]AEA47217.1 inorganic polyphosphate/ATP-NAD kinase [Archaeoglobus veneficus SNP6]